MIDSHTHRYPPEVYSNPGKFAQKQGESHWLELVEPSQGVKIAGMGIKGENDRGHGCCIDKPGCSARLVLGKS